MFKKKGYRVTNLPDVSAASTEKILPTAKQEKKGVAPRANRPFLGFFYTILCSAFIILSSVIVKKLTYISPGQLSMIRNLGTLVGSLPIVIYQVKNILGPKKYWCMLLVRSFMGSTALYFNLMAYRFLPLAVASIIISSLPALVLVTAHFYLKEPCGWIPTLSIVVTMSGVLLSIRLPEVLKDSSSIALTDPNYLVGLGFAIGCILILSLTIVTLRKMSDVHFAVVLLYFGVVGGIENAVIVHFLSKFSLPKCGWDTIQMMMIGILGFGGHCFLTLAIQVEEAGIVSIVKSSSDIILSMILQVIFFDFTPDIYNIGGAALVITSVSMLGLRKWLLTLPKDSIPRKKLGFMLL